MRRIAIAYSWGKVRIGAIALLGMAAFAIPAFASLTTPRAQTAAPVPGIYVADEGPPRAATPAVASPVLSYALTTMTNPVVPGQAAVFIWTVTNLTNAAQSSNLCYIVPKYTELGANQAGFPNCTGGSAVPAGSSVSGIINLTVLNGVSTPPDGAPINLTINDTNNGASISRNVTVQWAPEAGLALSTPDGSFVPLESFTTTLTYSNYSD